VARARLEAGLLVERVWRVEAARAVVRTLGLSVDAAELHLCGGAGLLYIVVFLLTLGEFTGFRVDLPIVRVFLFMRYVNSDISTRDAALVRLLNLRLRALLLLLCKSLRVLRNGAQVVCIYFNLLLLLSTRCSQAGRRPVFDGD